nr:hypothetical protein Hi04_10k_c2441B_00015 [uncultured bacterium]
MKPHRWTEAARRFADRRQLEDESPRLRDRVPALATLRLEVSDGRSLTTADVKHSRIVVVDTAPALFSLTCGDHACRGGGHDVTNAVMRGLLAGATKFEVDDLCYGNLGTAECGRTVRVAITATYRAEGA